MSWFALHFTLFIIKGSQNMNSDRAGTWKQELKQRLWRTWKQELKQRPWRSVDYWLAPSRLAQPAFL